MRIPVLSEIVAEAGRGGGGGLRLAARRVLTALWRRAAPSAQALVSHPRMQAVGFTGSRAAGQSLMRTAAASAQPIPVYAEMSSVNPVFLLPGAWRNAGSKSRQGCMRSVTLGVGQFCTNPGPGFRAGRGGVGGVSRKLVD